MTRSADRTSIGTVQTGGLHPMANPNSNLQSYLDDMGVRYRLSHHPTAYTAQDLAMVEHVAGRKVVKPVVVRADGEFVMCALPACYRVDLEELRQQLQASDVAIADGRYEIAGQEARKMWTSIICVRKPEAWRIAAIRNMLPAPPAR